MDDFNIDDYEVSERLPKTQVDYEEEDFNLKSKISNFKIRDQAIENLEKESLDLAKTILAPFAVHSPAPPKRFKFNFKLPNPWLVGAIFLILVLLLRK